MNSEWNSRANNFDFLRLALAVLVIYSHAYPLATGSEAMEPMARLTHGQMTGGALAVDSFFIMSGFLIAASAERSRSVAGFFKKRFSRIYPAFVVSALLLFFVVAPLASVQFSYANPWRRLANFAACTLRLREFAYTSAFAGNLLPNAMNGSTWSIPFEFWCYVGVALLLISGLLRRRAVVAVLFVAAWVAGVAFRVEGWVLGGSWVGWLVGVPQLWARLLPFYLAGVVFYLYRERIPRRAWLAALSGVVLIVASLVDGGWSAAFPVAGSYLLFWFAYSPGIRLHHAGRFGDFSYGTYLYAFPIEQLLMLHFGHTIAPGMLFVCATPLTLLAAVASWYGVERHFLRPERRKESAVALIESAQVG